MKVTFERSKWALAGSAAIDAAASSGLAAKSSVDRSGGDVAVKHVGV